MFRFRSNFATHIWKDHFKDFDMVMDTETDIDVDVETDTGTETDTDMDSNNRQITKNNSDKSVKLKTF